MTEPTAYLHTMWMEQGQIQSRLTHTAPHPFGLPGKHYSAEYKITTTPLYAEAPRCEVQTAIEQAAKFDAQNLEYARDLLGDLDDEYPDNETIVAQWFRKVRTETILAARSASGAEGSVNPLDWLAKHPNYELSFCGWDEYQVWELHSVNGGRNDREWTLLATGATPEEALRKAMAVPSASRGTEA